MRKRSHTHSVFGLLVVLCVVLVSSTARGQALMIDPSIRAFDVQTGMEVWKAQLPASGGATPTTDQTRAGGMQYLVIAAGGHPKVTEEKQADEIVAFSLP